MNPLERWRKTAKPKPISYEELRKMLGGVSKSTVWDWCNDKVLPPARVWSKLSEATSGKVTIGKMVKHAEAVNRLPKKRAA